MTGPEAIAVFTLRAPALRPGGRLSWGVMLYNNNGSSSRLLGAHTGRRTLNPREVGTVYLTYRREYPLSERNDVPSVTLPHEPGCFSPDSLIHSFIPLSISGVRRSVRAELKRVTK